MDTYTLPRLGLPNLGLGVGLRNKHFNYLLHNPAQVDWFEIISENFMDDFGFARHVLMHVRKQVPVVMHGVSLSVGSTDPINFIYLEKLKALAEAIEPEWISDHLCWTGVAYTNTHDLLPMPMTQESLAHVCERVMRIQDYLKRLCLLLMQWSVTPGFPPVLFLIPLLFQHLLVIKPIFFFQKMPLQFPGAAWCRGVSFLSLRPAYR